MSGMVFVHRRGAMTRGETTPKRLRRKPRQNAKDPLFFCKDMGKNYLGMLASTKIARIRWKRPTMTFACVDSVVARAPTNTGGRVATSINTAHAKGLSVNGAKTIWVRERFGV